MDLLRIVTAGSVDDGKSTLIGHLMAICGALKKDQLQIIKDKSDRLGHDYLDWSLATDGLLSEREQGITIDISHIFLNQSDRRLAILDAPGHVQYTRNMVTGASIADVALLLIDARNGLTEQTRRHLYIMGLLGIKHFLFVVNKMDLVNYDQSIFKNISESLSALHEHYQIEAPYKIIPISALKGDGISYNSHQSMTWYTGQSLLENLLNLSSDKTQYKEKVFDVQYVIRPKTKEFHDYRGYAGKQRSGSLEVGESIYISTFNTRNKITSIQRYGDYFKKVHQGQNAVITLEDDCDVSRGSLIVHDTTTLSKDNRLVAKICWLCASPLKSKNKYLLQLGSHRVKSKIEHLHFIIDLKDGTKKVSETIEMNQIGEIEILLSSPILFKSYKENRELGRFILIDENTNETVGVAFIN